MTSAFKLLRCLILILAVSLAFGCAAKGPAFSKISTSDIPEGKGLIYVYRPSGIVGCAVSYGVHAGQENVGKLVPGSYLTYFARPGELEIWARTEAKASVTLDVRQGQEHYVKGTLGVGAFVGRPKLEVVTKETGSQEIKDCNRSQ